MDIKISLDPTLALFYANVANAAGLSIEKVLSDALFKLAAELSLEALKAGAERKG